MAHLLMENRHGLVVEACVTPATGTSEREAAATMMREHGVRRGATVGADKAMTRRTSSPRCAVRA